MLTALLLSLHAMGLCLNASSMLIFKFLMVNISTSGIAYLKISFIYLIQNDTLQYVLVLLATLVGNVKQVYILVWTLMPTMT